MRVVMFQPQFAPMVVDGRKRQTIRKKARCKPGDTLSLRRWTGKPYRSKHLVLRTETCLRVEEVRIYEGPTSETAEACARADGFATFAQMQDWFRRNHGLPFAGEKIVW